MSLTAFADPTLRVSWVLSKLDQILQLDARGRMRRSSDNLEAEIIRQAILSMRDDITTAPALKLDVSNNSNPDSRKNFHTDKECKVHDQ